MAKKGENIFKRKDGRYEARYVKERGENNRIVKYGFVYGKSYLEVKRKRQIKIENLKKDDVNKKKLKNEYFSSSILNWIESKIELKSSSYYNYYSIINGRLIPFFKNIKLADINDEKILKLTLHLKEEGLGNKRIKEILLLLNQFLKSKNIFLNIKYPNVTKSKISTLTDEEIKTIEQDALKGNDIKKFAILLTLFTGMRIGELCALTWSDIDLEKKIIYINKTVVRVKSDIPDKKKTTNKITSPKSESSIREIPINEDLVKYLTKYYSPKDTYFLTGNSNFLSTNKFYFFYRKYLKSLKIHPYKFHILRHTFATRALTCGIDIKTLSEILGHCSVKITLDIYVHITNDEKLKQINKLSLITK